MKYTTGMDKLTSTVYDYGIYLKLRPKSIVLELLYVWVQDIWNIYNIFAS